MSRILNAASVVAVGMTATAMLLLAEPGFASDLATSANLPAITLPGADAPAEAEQADLSTEAAQPVATPIPDSQDESDVEPKAAPLDIDSLAELIAATPRALARSSWR